jgi:imidazoleglycerol-phosphate dehydratase
MRESKVSRETKETNLKVELGLDGSGQCSIATGIGFLDHMLSHVAVHGLFDLKVKAKGDLQVDPHHTVEDAALALGQAFDEALGDRAGITRIASATVPMDEALATVAVDLSGRPYAVVEASWTCPMLGLIPTTLIPHFLQSFAVTARANVHARVLYGRDDHHKAEALFKALGRALGAATRPEARLRGEIPSTKGKL